MDREKKENRKKKARAYLEKHDIEELFGEAMKGLLETMPEDPHSYLSDFFGQACTNRGVATDYSAIDSLWVPLVSHDVRLVRGSWITALNNKGEILPRRQDCPEEAFISLEELQGIHDASCAKPAHSEHKRAPIISVSYFWRTKEHPDPNGITLGLVAKAIEARRSTFHQYGIEEVGVFFDWLSLYQAPRSDDELEAFKRSLAFINLWYAHALVTCFLVTDTPAELVHYYERGWTSFEYQLAWLIKIADLYNVWPQVVDLGKDKRGRPPPIEPEAFSEGHKYGKKHFTNGADRKLVARKFRDTCEHVFGTTLELDFDSLAWGDEEVDQLADVLKFCDKLEKLYLSNNSFEHLPETIGNVTTLQNLNLSGCRNLRTLPDSLCRNPSLKVLDLSNCCFDSLPESVCEIISLEQLILFGCQELKTLPQNIGNFKQLRVLNVQRCASLALPEEGLQLLRQMGCYVAHDDETAVLELVVASGALVDSNEVSEARCKYQVKCDTDHGTVINPITGESLDIMQQCVNLQLEMGVNRQVGDTDAYKEIVIDFAEQVQCGTKAWVEVEKGKYYEGAVSRVNSEDERNVTYDFQYFYETIENGKPVTKTMVLKDRTRLQLKTQPILVKGDPAAGKTTFTKQLITWIMRNQESAWLVPVMIRTVDLVRSASFFNDDGRDMVDQYLAMHHISDGSYYLFSRARQEGRLLVILDGFDEAGALERKLTAEMSEKLINEVFVVLTSRDVAGTFEVPAFSRFRSVRVRELNPEQQRQVIKKSLKTDERVEAFCQQLELNPALSQMAKNPLLLNVTIAVFKSPGDSEVQTLNRASVYKTALDGMLSRLELGKASQVSAELAHQSEARNMRNQCVQETIPMQVLRAVLKRIAFIAHTHDKGQGIRDFGRDLVESAIATSGVGTRFTMAHWEMLEVVIKKGRLPVLSWFVENEKDVFRFAHLTFQEFLCAEQCFDESTNSETFISEWRELVCPIEPMQILKRGWWQQVIQMYCDLVTTAKAQTKSGINLSVALGQSFLRLSAETPALSMSHGVNDSNIQTLTSMLDKNDVMTECHLAREISSQGISTIASLSAGSLQILLLDYNNIGPDGCKSIASFLKLSAVQLKVLSLVGNIICQGAPKENMAPACDRNRPTGYYDSYLPDLDGLSELLGVVENHRALKTFDIRSNLINLDAGRMLSRHVFANDILEEVCGINVLEIRGGDVTELDFTCKADFWQRGSGPSCAFLSTGDAEFLLELLLRHTQAKLNRLSLRSQALGSDVEGVVPLYDKLGTVVANAPQMVTLDVTGFWDCGAEAGNKLGTRIKDHPQLMKVGVGLGTIDFDGLRKLQEQEDGQALKVDENIRDTGAGILSACLPKCVTNLDLRNAGVGASGYMMLACVPHLKEFNGGRVNLTLFTEDCTKLDLSADPPKSSSAVACVIERTLYTPNLKHLNISGSTLTSKSHVHTLTPVLGSGSIRCDGGCDNVSFRGTNAYQNCEGCDLDFCSTCAMSGCPMVALGVALHRLPHLVSLKMANCNFQGPTGRSSKDVVSYESLGGALGAHKGLTELDISENYFTGPGFKHLAKGIATMPALSEVKLGSGIIDFKHWLHDAEISGSAGWTSAELLLFVLAIARNRELKRLDLSEVSKFKSNSRESADAVEALVESLDAGAVSNEALLDGGAGATSSTRSCSNVVGQRRIQVETVLLDNVEFPFAQLQDGTLSTLDLSTEELTNRQLLAPVFALLLEVGTSLVELDLSKQDFGDATSRIVNAVLPLVDGYLRKYNKVSLTPASDLNALSLQGQPVMPHGISVIAASALLRASVMELNLSACRMDAESLGRLLTSVLKNGLIRSLDVSDQPLGKDGLINLADFLCVDTKLQVLCARNISIDQVTNINMSKFVKAIETNITLATLDLRQNYVPDLIADQLRRTMEEKRRIIPLPMESKVCFLLCNEHMTPDLQLPKVLQVASHDETDGPVFTIFKFSAQVRCLMLDSEPKANGVDEYY
jgi:Leucine-rich repeat (LRR) protein